MVRFAGSQLAFLKKSLFCRLLIYNDNRLFVGFFQKNILVVLKKVVFLHPLSPEKRVLII